MDGPLNSMQSKSKDGLGFPLLLRRAWYGLNQAFRRRITHLAITPDQYTVLRNLRECGEKGLTQKALTRKMSSDPNTVASLLERMETAGLLERNVDEHDRRARRIHLLPLGQERYQQARQIAHELQSDILSTLPTEDCAVFMRDLQQMADACREAAARSPKGKKAS